MDWVISIIKIKISGESSITAKKNHNKELYYN